MKNSFPTTRLTVLLPAGRLPQPILEAVAELAMEYRLETYLTTLQNLRIMGIQEGDLPKIRGKLAALGAQFKGPGRFPVPRTCIGKRDCTTGIIDPAELSDRILEHFKGREKTKPKLKIAIAGCALSCSGAVSSDIGIIASRKGYDLYVGGKGGGKPVAGRRILRDIDEQRLIAVIEELVNFHDAHTMGKQRMVKLIDHPDFPYKGD